MTFTTELPFADTGYKTDFEPLMAAAMAPAMMTSAMMMEGYAFWWNMTRSFVPDFNIETKAHAFTPVEVPAEMPVASMPSFDPLVVEATLDTIATSADVQALDETHTVLEGQRPLGLVAARETGPDDLKLISGIGPKIEGILNELGIFHFDQIAAWTSDEMNWVDGYLNFKGRILRDGWLAQADALASGGPEEYVRRFGKEPR